MVSQPSTSSSTVYIILSLSLRSVGSAVLFYTLDIPSLWYSCSSCLLVREWFYLRWVLTLAKHLSQRWKDACTVEIIKCVTSSKETYKGFLLKFWREYFKICQYFNPFCVSCSERINVCNVYIFWTILYHRSYFMISI